MKTRRKNPISWDGLIQDAENQIAHAKRRIEELKDCIVYFRKQGEMAGARRVMHDAKNQIARAKWRIEELKDFILFFRQQRPAGER
jgi:uncharacterized protein YeeX (DUF496 family)